MSGKKEVSDIVEFKSKDLCKRLIMEMEKWLAINAERLPGNKVRLLEGDIDVVFNSTINFAGKTLSKTLFEMQKSHPDDDDFYEQMITQLLKHLLNALNENIKELESGEEIEH